MSVKSKSWCQSWETQKHIQISMCHRFYRLRDKPHTGPRDTTRCALRRAFQWCALEILRTIIELVPVRWSSNLYFFVARTEYSVFVAGNNRKGFARSAVPPRLIPISGSLWCRGRVYPAHYKRQKYHNHEKVTRDVINSDSFSVSQTNKCPPKLWLYITYTVPLF